MAVDLTKPVLVVDDYNAMIRIMHNLLKQLGFEQVDDASDGSSALTELCRRDYGLVISDWNMEPIDRLRAAAGNALRPFARRNSLHHGHGGIENRGRDRCEACWRVELHRQAIQRADAEDQDRRGVRRRTDPAPAA